MISKHTSFLKMYYFSWVLLKTHIYQMTKHSHEFSENFQLIAKRAHRFFFVF